MTNENIAENLSYDWRNLGYAQVAGQYLEQLGEKGIPYAKKSLEIILKDCDIKDPWIVKTVSDPDVLVKTIQSQLETYGQCMEEQTVGNLMDYYRNDLANYLGDNMPKAEAELSPFADENYGDVLKNIAKAKYIIEGKEHGRSSDEEVEVAKKTIEKYEKINTTINILKQKKISGFRNRVDEGVTKDALNQLYFPKEK